METIGSWWLWTGFSVLVVAMLAVDLFLAKGGKRHRVSTKEAALWSLIWVVLSLAFAGALWGYLDHTSGRTVANEKALAFLTGYAEPGQRQSRIAGWCPNARAPSRHTKFAVPPPPAVQSLTPRPNLPIPLPFRMAA